MMMYWIAPFLCASIVAATEIYVTGDEYQTRAMVEGKVVVDYAGDHYVSVAGEAHFEFSIPDNSGNHCKAKLKWPRAQSHIYMNTDTLCLQNEAGSSESPIEVTGIKQCCQNQQPYSRKQSALPEEPGTKSGTDLSKVDVNNPDLEVSTGTSTTPGAPEAQSAEGEVPEAVSEVPEEVPEVLEEVPEVPEEVPTPPQQIAWRKRHIPATLRLNRLQAAANVRRVHARSLGSDQNLFLGGRRRVKVRARF